MKNEKTAIDRRAFLKTGAAAAGLMAAAPSYIAGQSAASPNSKINIAIVGVGGKGRGPTIESVSQNVVALCDVDMGHVNANRQEERMGAQFSEAIDTHVKRGAVWFEDYREMFTQLGDKIDAVIISTPDHMHFPIALSALNLGMHVYCEKPLTHTVEEARILAKVAQEKGVVTQMGNQGHSNGGTRLVREWVQAGLIGEIKEVHSWTNRPIGSWKDIHATSMPDHSRMRPVVPDGLNWDLWQGVAAPRPYDPTYLPFSWRGFLDYGAGALGDMACHIMDAPYWALDLGSPESIEASTTRMTGYTYPTSSLVTFKFPARGNMPPVTYKWYDGDMRPPVPEFLKNISPPIGQARDNGSLIVGEEAALLTDTYSASVRIVPNEKMAELRPQAPAQTLRRIKGSHLQEFYDAIMEGRPASSDFSYAGPFTETVLLGCVAQQTGRAMRFNGDKGTFIDDPEADKLLSKEYPNGWIIS